MSEPTDTDDDSSIDTSDLTVGDTFLLREDARLIIIGRTEPTESPDTAPTDHYTDPLYEARIRFEHGDSKRAVYGPHNIDAALAGGAEYIGSAGVKHTAEPFWCAGCGVACTGNELHSLTFDGDKVCSYGCAQRVDTKRRKEKHDV